MLLARVEGAPLGDVLEETILGPLGMTDTSFAIGEGDVHRMTSYYRRDPDGGGLVLVDSHDGQWAKYELDATGPAFPSGAGGLVSTADDWLAFGTRLLAQGEHNGRSVLSMDSVRLMTTSHVEVEVGNPFLEGQGWGFGGGVDLLQPTESWHVPGRYGWIGGTGTAGYIIASRGTVAVYMSQVALGRARRLQ